jgi:hypothetical protein
MPTFIQREGESIKKLEANRQEELPCTSPEELFGGDKATLQATLQRFERTYLGI